MPNHFPIAAPDYWRILGIMAHGNQFRATTANSTGNDCLMKTLLNYAAILAVAFSSAGCLEQLKANATVDWHKRESARARMRVLVKRILKKYGYPPDLADDAVKTVLEQAEVLLRQLG